MPIQWCIKIASSRMIGSGIPINHSKAPLPKPMIASLFFLTNNSTKVRQFRAAHGEVDFFQGMERDLRFRIFVLEDGTGPPGSPN
jgi:hypothetical protein